MATAVTAYAVRAADGALYALRLDALSAAECKVRPGDVVVEGMFVHSGIEVARKAAVLLLRTCSDNYDAVSEAVGLGRVGTQRRTVYDYIRSKCGAYVGLPELQDLLGISKENTYRCVHSLLEGGLIVRRFRALYSWEPVGAAQLLETLPLAKQMPALLELAWRDWRDAWRHANDLGCNNIGEEPR